MCGGANAFGGIGYPPFFPCGGSPGGEGGGSPNGGGGAFFLGFSFVGGGFAIPFGNVNSAGGGGTSGSSHTAGGGGFVFPSGPLTTNLCSLTIAFGSAGGIFHGVSFPFSTFASLVVGIPLAPGGSFAIDSARAFNLATSPLTGGVPILCGGSLTRPCFGSAFGDAGAIGGGPFGGFFWVPLLSILLNSSSWRLFLRSSSSLAILAFLSFSSCPLG